MKNSPALHFPGAELAKKIAEIHGKPVQTIIVKMIGKKDVAELLDKMRKARTVAPSSTFRSKAVRAF